MVGQPAGADDWDAVHDDTVHALKEAERRMGCRPGSDGGHSDAERASSKAKNYSALSYGIAMGNSRVVSSPRINHKLGY